MIFASPETTILAIFAVVELVVNVFNSALLIAIELVAKIEVLPPTVSLFVTSVSFDVFSKLPPIVAFTIVVLSVVVIFVLPETTIFAIFAVVELAINVFNSASLTTRASDSLLNIPSILALFTFVVF